MVTFRINKIMRLKDFFLIERVIPMTSYGYWISPMCDIHPVPFEGHDLYIMQNYNMTVADALLGGWVRIIAPSRNNNISIETLPRPSDRCKMLLGALCKDKDRITIDLLTDDGLIGQSFQQWSQAARFISDPMRMRARA